MYEVSIIIPVFNRQELGERAVLSACAQNVPGTELIIVDDGSHPPFCLPAINSNVEVRLVRLESNRGASAARNAGIRMARGKWIALLDSDDHWLPGTLRPRLEHARQSAAGGLVACAAGFIIQKRSSDPSDARIPQEANSAEEFSRGCWFAPGSTILFRKEVFDRIGPWDEELPRLEDYDWFLRLGLAGGSLKVWDAIAAIIEIEGKPPIGVLEAAAVHLLTKYVNRCSPSDLPEAVARHVKAYVDVERASARWYQRQRTRAMLYLARSFLRAPRLSVHLGRFWRAPSHVGRMEVKLSGAVALNEGRCMIAGGVLDVATDPRSGGYSALVPLAVPTGDTLPARYSCRLQLLEGAVGVSAVRADCTIIAERMLNHPGHVQLDIIVPDKREIAAIMVRNYAMTGRPSRVHISGISVELCAADDLPLLPRRRPSYRLHLPLRGGAVRDLPREAPTTTALVELDTALTATIIIDAWETLGDHIERNIVEKLAPTLTALRSLGVAILHSPHDEAIHPLARPLDGEVVIRGEFIDTDYVAQLLRDAGVTHLLYLGYLSNMCVLSRSLGMLEMSKRGFKTILVRDASAAAEIPESESDEWFHRAAVHFIELQGGATISAAELQNAIRAALATTPAIAEAPPGSKD
jgi:glycosyltransferase involved in cell wall biosynthesis